MIQAINGKSYWSVNSIFLDIVLISSFFFKFMYSLIFLEDLIGHPMNVVGYVPPWIRPFGGWGTFPIWVGVLVKVVSFCWWLLCLFSSIKVYLSTKRRIKIVTLVFIIIHYWFFLFFIFFLLWEGSQPFWGTNPSGQSFGSRDTLLNSLYLTYISACIHMPIMF